MLIAIGANHHGYQVREMLIESLRQLGHEVIDSGSATTGRWTIPTLLPASPGKWGGRKQIGAS